MRRKKGSKLAYILMMVVLATSLTIALSACSIFGMVINLLKGTPPAPVDKYDEVEEFEAEYKAKWWYLGDKAYTENFQEDSTFSIQEFFGDYFEIGQGEGIWTIDNTNIATMDGENISIKSVGDIVMTITNTKTGAVKTQPYKIIEGVNIYTFEDLYTATNLGRPVIIQQDLTLEDASAMSGENFGCPNKNFSMMVTKNIYGNGHRIYSQGLTFKSETNDSDWFRTVFDVVGNHGIVIDGIYMSGRTCEDGEERSIGEYEPYGCLISFSESGAGSVAEFDANPTKYPKNIIKNSVLENANRIVTISNSRVHFEGTYVRNGADSCISIGTFGDRGGSDISYNNCVLENGLVATMLFYCYQASKAPNFGRMSFSGFVELYNWKNTKNTALMPQAEDVAGLVNPIIAGELSKKEYAPLFYWSDDKVDSYVNCGIIVIATGAAKINNPEFVGYEDQGFDFRSLPLPKAAGAFINVCQIMGYNISPPVKPLDPVAMDAERLQELWFGRAE